MPDSTGAAWWPDALDAFSRTAGPDVQEYHGLLQEAGSRCIVELGGGTGRLTLPLAKLGYRVCAVEPVPVLRRALAAKVEASDFSRVIHVLSDVANLTAEWTNPEARVAWILPYNLAYHFHTANDLGRELARAIRRNAHQVLLDVDDCTHLPAMSEPFQRRLHWRKQIFLETVNAFDPNDFRVRRVEWGRIGVGNTLWTFLLRLHSPREIESAVVAYAGREALWSWRRRLTRLGPELVLDLQSTK